MRSLDDDARDALGADPAGDLIDGGLGREGDAAEGPVAGGADQVGARRDLQRTVDADGAAGVAGAPLGRRGVVHRDEGVKVGRGPAAAQRVRAERHLLVPLAGLADPAPAKLHGEALDHQPVQAQVQLVGHGEHEDDRPAVRAR